MSSTQIQDIEHAYLPLTKKIELLLLLLHEKPATILECPTTSQHGIESVSPQPGRALELVTRIDLPFTFGDIRKYEKNTFLQDIYVGSTEYWHDQIRAADKFFVEHLNPLSLKEFENAPAKREYEQEVGRCYGFPETATRAYLGEIPHTSSKVEPHDPLYFFTHFIFSKDHVHEELKTSERWRDAVRNASPILYQKIIRKCAQASDAWIYDP